MEYWGRTGWGTGPEAVLDAVEDLNCYWMRYHPEAVSDAVPDQKRYHLWYWT